MYSLVQTDLSKLKPSPKAQGSFLEEVVECLEVMGLASLQCDMSSFNFRRYTHKASPTKLVSLI